MQPLLKNTDYAGYLDKVAGAVAEYDFDTALGALKRLTDDLGINL